MRLLLDTGVLGCICHPRKHADVRAWFRRALREHAFLISEVADYVTAPPEALDGDVLIGAQAIEDDATIVTTNTKHFEALAVLGPCT